VITILDVHTYASGCDHMNALIYAKLRGQKGSETGSDFDKF